MVTQSISNINPNGEVNLRRVIADKTKFFLEVVYDLLPVTYKQLLHISRDYALLTVLDTADFVFTAFVGQILT